MACGLFADDVVAVLLGPKWKDAAQIFRLLAPTIFVFAICNPLGWLLTALGLVGRALKIALVLAPLMVAGYMLGLPFGARGVALAYSATMLLWIIPVILWAVHGTGISFRDIVLVVSRPLVSVTVAAGIALASRLLYGHLLSVLPRLVLENAVLLGIYFALLLFVAGEKALFLDLIRGWKGTPATEPKSVVVSI
jgi:PST family polysaccharide transporter